MKKEIKIMIGAVFSMLLVVAIGLSLSYFVASSNTDGEGGTTDVQTVILEKGGELKVEGTLEFNDLDILPGHKNISAIKVTATGYDELYFNLIWTGINSLNTPINYTVYKTTTEQTPSVTCNKIIKGQMYYEECTNNNFTNLGSPVSSGTITTSESLVKHNISKYHTLQATQEGNTVYFYVVLEYPNLDEAQNIDMEGKFEGTVSAELLKKEDMPITVDNIIAANNPKDQTEPLPDFSKTATTNEGVFKVSDGMYGGDSYYWRGAATTNYVKFANFCWRIVRINGDGSIRLIYDGTTCHANGANAESIAVTSQTYSKDAVYNRSEYVGYTYAEGSQRTLSGTASNLKTQTESWYKTNITDKGFDGKVATGKFCNDRNTASGSTWASQPTSTFYYAARERLQTNKTPTLSCPSGDVYTLKAGAITADEVSFAGGVYGIANSSYYLYNGQNYWTMSPNQWSSSAAWVFYVNAGGYLSGNGVDSARGLRPVINLKADTLFKEGGNGTQNNPYEVL